MVPFVTPGNRQNGWHMPAQAHVGVKLRNVELTGQHILQEALWHDGDGYASQQHSGITPDSEPQMPDAACTPAPSVCNYL